MFRFFVLSALLACAFGNGIPTGRIIGGKDTEIENHPHQVLVRYPNGSPMCGGSIIGSRMVLTAAHCVEKDPTGKYTIQYGVTKIGKNENVISVAKTISHPDYNTHKNFNNDVCVLLLNDDIPFNKSAQPIELAREEPSAGAKAVVTGWGYLNVNAWAPSTVLQEVDVEIIGREECKLANAMVLNVEDNMVCAGVDGYGKDCKGDSGGPLVVDGELVGVVSWSMECGQLGHPGVYANVAGLHDWIIQYKNV